MIKLLFFLTLFFNLAHAHAAVFVVFNSEALIDGPSSDPLEGTNISGDLLQLLFPGPNLVPDSPDEFGGPGGDDFYIPVNSGPTSTHVGANEPMSNWNSGIFNATYDISPTLVGENVFLRFWNAGTPGSATHYGDSAIFNIPPEPAIGPIFLDFVPTTSDPRTANTAFSARDSAPVPEPSTMPFLALFIGIFIYQVRRWSAGAPALRALLFAGSLCYFWAPENESVAQLAPRFDVTASRPIMDLSAKAPLQGNNPKSDLYGFTNITGAVIQIIDAGANGEADLPDMDGNLGGDDSLYATVFIGEGISPSEQLSGLLATSIANPPAVGTRLYARAFNAPSIEDATHWGQSAIFTVTPLQIMDLSLLGLRATTIPLGVDIADTDSDGDGFTDLEELLANTSALDATEVLAIEEVTLTGEGKTRFSFVAQPGRIYFIECSTTPLGLPPEWNLVAVTAVAQATEIVELEEDTPVDGGIAVYRLLVAQP